MKVYILSSVILTISLTASGFESINESTNVDEQFSQKSKSNKNIIIGAASLTNLVEKNGLGVYQQIMRLALQGTNYHVTEKFLPFRRALLEFEQNHVDCNYSSTELLQDKFGSDAIISSYPLGVFIFYIFTKQDTKAISNLNDLNNLRTGGINGQAQYYQDLLPKDAKLQLLNTDKQGMKMLNLNRLDAFIAALPDLTPYIGELSFDRNYPIYTSFDRITCHNTEKNKDFLNLLSSALSKLKTEGSYKKIAGEFYIDF